MKSKSLFIMVLVISIITTPTQGETDPKHDSKDKGYVGLSLGPSIPIGDFASTNVENDFAGLAKTGGIFEFSFAYKLGKNFGIGALLRGQSNGINEDALLDAFGVQGAGLLINIESKSWQLGGLLFGGYGSFPIGLNNRTSFDMKFMVGFVNATSPEIKITTDVFGTPIWFRQGSVTATSFGILLGGGFKFNVGNRVCLLTSLDFMSAKPEFRNVPLTDNSGNYETNTFSQTMSTVNFGFGIGLRL